MEPGELLQRIKKGDREAERALINNYWRTLRFILYKRCQNEAQIDDVAQETMIRVLESARNGKIREPGALPSYIKKTCIYIIQEGIRKEIRHSTDCTEDMDLFADVDNSSPLQHLMTESSKNAVIALLHEMPAKRDRTILQEYFIYDKSKKQLCGELDISPEHFDRVLYRARSRLKKLLKERYPGKFNGPSDRGINILFLLGLLLNSASNHSPKDFFKILVREPVSSQHLVDEQFKNTLVRTNQFDVLLKEVA